MTVDYDAMTTRSDTRHRWSAGVVLPSCPMVNREMAQEAPPTFRSGVEVSVLHVAAPQSVREGALGRRRPAPGLNGRQVGRQTPIQLATTRESYVLPGKLEPATRLERVTC